MSITITDEETCRLASELAELTGDTTTGAVTMALRKAVEREREVQEKVRKLMAIGERCAAIIQASGIEVPSSEEIDDWLYDEQGAPR